MNTLGLILQNSVTQFALLYGGFIAGGALLTLVSRWTVNAYRQFLFPNLGTYVFGFIGVPIHEFSHALFCRLFAHEVKKVKWFDPGAKGGSHGSVTHLYHPWNPYQRMGHLFIGLGPVLIGPLLLALLFYFLIPGGRLFFTTPVSSWHDMQALFAAFFRILFQKEVWLHPGSYVFLYLATCISSQMELSSEDWSQVIRGLPWNFGFVIGINTLAWIFAFSWHGSLVALGYKTLAMSASFFAFSGLLALANLALCTFLLSLINRLCGRDAINPFRGEVG